MGRSGFGPDNGGQPNFHSQGAPDEANFQQQQQQHPPLYGPPQQQAYGIPGQPQQQQPQPQPQPPPLYGVQHQPHYVPPFQPVPYPHPQHQAQVPPYYYHPQPGLLPPSPPPPPPPPPNAPYSRPGPPNPYVQQQYWTSGIFDCFKDMQSCIITFLIPCITYGQIAEILDQGTTGCVHSGLMYFLILSCFGVPCFYSYTARSKLRYRYSLPEDPMSDLCTHVFCEVCALCQEYRELKNRGMDPAIGWTANQIKQNREIMMMAPTAPTMAR